MDVFQTHNSCSFVPFVPKQTDSDRILACIWLAFSRAAGKNLSFMESQDAAATFFLKWWPQIEANKNKIMGGAAVVIVAVAIFSFISWRHAQTQIDAGEALTQALMTAVPGADSAKAASAYLDVSADYPNTPAGQRSLLQGAAQLFIQGKYSDAQNYFQQYLNDNPDGAYSGQASLGVAKSLEAQNKLNDAQGAYQHIITDSADPQAVVAAKFSLAQIFLEQKNYPNAAQLFQEVMQTDPYSVMGNEAGQYLYDLRSKMPAPAAPATGAPTAPATGAPSAPASQFKLNH